MSKTDDRLIFIGLMVTICGVLVLMAAVSPPADRLKRRRRYLEDELAKIAGEETDG